MMELVRHAPTKLDATVVLGCIQKKAIGGMISLTISFIPVLQKKHASDHRVTRTKPIRYTLLVSVKEDTMETCVIHVKRDITNFSEENVSLAMLVKVVVP